MKADVWSLAMSSKNSIMKTYKKLCSYYTFLRIFLVKIMGGRICNVLKSKWNLKRLGSNNWRIHLCYIFWTYVVYTVKFDILYVPFHLALLQLNEHNFSYDNEKKKLTRIIISQLQIRFIIRFYKNNKHFIDFLFQYDFGLKLSLM